MSKFQVSQSIFIQKSFNGVELSIVPDKTHEFLLTTAEVAKGFGVDDNVIRWHKFNHKSELLENTHFISSVSLTNARGNLKSKQVYWTRRGIVRLGFYIDSQQGIKFRDWIENLVIEGMDKTDNCPSIYRSDIMSNEYHDLNIRSFQFQDSVYFIGDDAVRGLGRNVLDVIVDQYKAWGHIKRFKIECANGKSFEYMPCISLDGLLYLAGKVRSSSAKPFKDWLAYSYTDESAKSIESEIRPAISSLNEIKGLAEQFNDIHSMLYLLEHITKSPQFNNDPQYQKGLKTAYDWFFKELNSFKTKINNAAN